jgi:hypothetical protein
MPKAKLTFGENEIELTDGTAVVGRATENTVSFPEDTNVSRNHAEIQYRDGEYWLVDLNSVNGTAVNGQRVSGEMLLQNGDYITFGGSSEVRFFLEKEEGDDDAASGAALAAGTPGGVTAGSEEPASNKTLLIAGGVCGLAVVCVLAAGVFYYTRGSSCAARAVVIKPEPGDTIITPTDIEVDEQDTGCVAAAIFTLDGQEVARATESPFTAKLDPKDFPEMSDGFDHALQIVLIDKNGETIAQPESVPLAFETREVNKPPATPEIVQGNTQQQRPGGQTGKQVSLIDIQEMSKRFVKEFSGNYQYNVSNKQFLAEIQKKAPEYAQDGYFERAAPFRDVINVAYVQEQNLDAPLGFMLAMSRSKFNPTKQGSDEGLWRMNSDFVIANGYNGLCGSESLSDPSQNCAAKASAIYMKALVFGVFDGDVLYSAAAFGKSPQDAGAWKATLPANRSDIWNSIRTPAEREQLVRFFAAGIVAENPQKFGLTKDRPLSELYRVTM